MVDAGVALIWLHLRFGEFAQELGA